MESKNLFVKFSLIRIDCMTTAISNYSIILNIYIWNLRTYLLNFHLKNPIFKFQEKPNLFIYFVHVLTL